MNVKEFLPNKKNIGFWLIGGAGATAIFVFERRKTAASDVSSTDVTATGDTADTGSYDSSQYDLSSDYGSGGYSPSVGGFYNPSGYGYTGDYSGQPVAQLPTTDEEWSVDATTLLGNAGNDSIAAGLAVGKYLLKQQLTQTQANMVTTAISQVGYPPQSGALPIRIAPSTGQNPTTPTPPKVANGYYRDIVHGYIWSVQDEVRHMVTPASWQRIYKSQHPHLTPITAVSNVYKLHRGSDI